MEKKKIKVGWFYELKESNGEELILKKSTTRLQMFLGFFVAILLIVFGVWKGNPDYQLIIITLAYSASVKSFNDFSKTITQKK